MLVNKTIQDQVENNSLQLEGIVNKIVAKYTGELDDYIDKIKDFLVNSEDELTDTDLNKILITLCTYSYFITSKQELLGIRADISEMVRQTKYSENYINSAGTIANRQMLSELAAKEEEVVSTVYNRAYKLLKNKADVITRYIDSVKKILSVRMSLMELTHKGA